MLSQPVIECTLIRAPHEAVVNIAWVELHITFAPLPFLMQHLFKVKFLLKASIRTKTLVSVSVYQSASHYHSYAHAKHGEQYAFQPPRHRTVPQEQGLLSPSVCFQLPNWSSVVTRGVHDPVAESASKCFGFALWHKEFDDFSLFVLALSSSFHDFTAQCIAVNPYIIHCQRQTLFSVF